MRRNEGWRWRAAQPVDELAMSREQILNATRLTLRMNLEDSILKGNC